MPRYEEADWKRLRRLHPVALDRFCARVLEEGRTLLADEEKTNHERYLALYRLLQERDDELADAFNDMRRSTAHLRLMRMQELGLLTEEEVEEFSPETREFLKSVAAGTYP
jgi:hypothetical protein